MKLIIGTRGSLLALKQTSLVIQQIREIDPDLSIETRVVKTTGDKIQDVPLAMVGGKGLFVKEIEEELLSRNIDLAIHSAKDLPFQIPDDLTIAGILKREDPRDLLISRDERGWESLPEDAAVGTSSLRRRSQLLHLRPSLQILTLRGNLDTRLRKLREGSFDAIVLAMAGMNRMGWSQGVPLSTEILLPAPGQGALALEARKDNPEVLSLVRKMAHEESARCIEAERAFLARLEGGCQVPLGALATLGEAPSLPHDPRPGQPPQALQERRTLTLEGCLGTPDGTILIRKKRTGTADDPVSLGVSLAEEILESGGREILDQIVATLQGPLLPPPIDPP